MSIFPRPLKQTLTVVEKEWMSKDIVRLKLATQNLLSFVPGQFATLYIDELTRRSYSISSLPENQFIETYNDNAPAGPGSRFFETCKVGQAVEAMVPLGRFVYTESAFPAYFIATGTGITPLMSMFKYALELRKTNREIRLLWGNKSEEEVFLLDELKELSLNHNNFKYDIFISRQPDTRFKSGRVTDFIKNESLLSNAEFYVCGGQYMIKDVENILATKGVTNEKIKYEQFY